MDLHERAAGEVHIAENTAVIDHVLSLKPCAVAEFMHLDCEQILAVGEIIGDIKFMRTEGILAVTDLHAVDIHIVCGFDTLERQLDSAVVRTHLRRNGKGLAVQADRIVVGRRIRTRDILIVVALPGHRNIAVDRKIEPLTRPAARQSDRFPLVCRIRGIAGLHGSVFHQVVCGTCVLDNCEIPVLPFTGQKLKIVRICPCIVIPYPCGSRGR